MKLVIVERTFSEPVTVEQVAARAASNPCLQARGVRFVRSLLSLDGLRMICEYEAPDAETVRQASRTSGVSFDRVWTAHEIRPENAQSSESAPRA